jgi:elongation factor P
MLPRAAAALLAAAARTTRTTRLASTSPSSSSFPSSTASFTKKRANELRTGAIVSLDSGALAVIEKYCYTQGSGRQLGLVTATLRSVGGGVGGGTRQARWRPGDDVTVARLQEKECTLLYREGGGGSGAGASSAASFVCMEGETFDQFAIPAALLGPVAAALLPDGAGLLLTLDPATGTPIAASPLETAVEVTVAEAPPPKTGAAPGNKAVVTEAGAVVRGVPNHVKVGDRLVVDTRDGSFVRRAG